MLRGGGNKLSVAVEILLNDELSGKLNGPIQAMDRLRDRAQAARTELLQTGAAAGGAFLAGMGMAMKGAADYADEIAKATQKTGMQTEALSALRYAAEQSGVSFQQLEMGLARMQRSAKEAADGSAMYAEAYQQLGVSVTDVNGELKAGETLFREIAQALAAMPNDTERAALAMEIFGRSGAQLLPLLNQGTQGIDKLMERAEKLGLVLDQETAEAAERFNDSLSDLKLGTQSIAMAISSSLFPALSENNEAIAEYLGSIAEFIKEHPTATKLVMLFAGGLSGAAVGAYALNQAVGLIKVTYASVQTLLEFYRARVIANTAAVEAETAALAKNTAAAGANAAAHGRAAAARGGGAVARGLGAAGTGIAGTGAATVTALGVGAAITGAVTGTALGAQLRSAGVFGEYQQTFEHIHQSQQMTEGYQRWLLGLDGSDRKTLMTEFSHAERIAVWKRAVSRDEPVQMAMSEVQGQGIADAGFQAVAGGRMGSFKPVTAGRGHGRRRSSGLTPPTPPLPGAANDAAQAGRGGATTTLDAERVTLEDLPRLAEGGGGRTVSGVASTGMMVRRGRVGGGRQSDLGVGPRGQGLRQMMGGLAMGGLGGGGLAIKVDVWVGDEKLDERQRKIAYEVVGDVVGA